LLCRHDNGAAKGCTAEARYGEEFHGTVRNDEPPNALCSSIIWQWA
jgi:hypothetical protein